MEPAHKNPDIRIWREKVAENPDLPKWNGYANTSEKVQFIEPNMWPTKSPDLNPVDYAIWGALQQMVYHRQSFIPFDELKRAIVEAWPKLLQSFIDKSVGEWRRCLDSGLCSATEWRTHWTHVLNWHVKCWFCVPVLLLFGPLMQWKNKLYAFITYYGYCHSLDAATIFSKVDSN